MRSGQKNSKRSPDESWVCCQPSLGETYLAGMWGPGFVRKGSGRTPSIQGAAMQVRFAGRSTRISMPICAYLSQPKSRRQYGRNDGHVLYASSEVPTAISSSPLVHHIASSSGKNRKSYSVQESGSTRSCWFALYSMALADITVSTGNVMFRPSMSSTVKLVG